MGRDPHDPSVCIPGTQEPVSEGHKDYTTEEHEVDCMTNVESFICIVLLIVTFSVLAIGYRRKCRNGRFDVECETALIVLVNFIAR